MLTAHSATPLAQLRHDNLVYAQTVKAHSNRHNIHDRVNRTDLVEVYILLRHSVSLALRLRDNIENLQRQSTRLLAHLRTVDNFNNLF